MDDHLGAPLGHKIKRGFFIIVALFAIFGAGMIFSIYEVGQNVPRVIHNNYLSIVAVGGMRSAWNGFRHLKSDPTKNQADLIQKFEESVALEKTAISEPGESDIVSSIQTLWEESKNHLGKPSHEESIKMRRLLNQLLDINHKAIFEGVAANNSMVRKVMVIGVLFLLMTLILSIFIAKVMAERLSAPLKKITNILYQNPSLDRHLTLPESATLEVNILSREMTKIWNRLSDMKQLDVEELAKRESKLQTILNSVDDAILVLDEKNVVVHCNPEMEVILGIKAKDAIGVDWSSLENVLELKNYEVLKEIFSVSNSPSLELSLNGKERFFEFQIKSIANDKGHHGTALLLRDVTEKYQQDRLKAEFIGVLSHELKTPLQSLSMGLELLYDKKKKFDAKDQLLIETVNDDAARIRAVASEFMHISRNQHHSLKLKFETVKLYEGIEGWLKPFRLVADNKNVRINLVNRLEKLESVRIDKVKFPWVLSNLLSNAIRMTPVGGVIQVCMQQREKQLSIEVVDQGPGIPLECRDKIFEPYFQVPRENTDIENGFLGIGLNIAREVIGAHDGTLEFRPNVPKGAIFEVMLPAHDFEGTL